MKSKQKSKLLSKLAKLPNDPGVYLLKDNTGRVIYVGKAKSLKNRVKAHLRGPFASQICDLDFIICPNELESLLKENSLIKVLMPKYNVLLRDDKQYPYLKITNEEFPRLIIARKKLDDNARYFGRFTGGAARELLKQIKRIFPIRWCKQSPLKNRRQTCIYEHIGHCIAPCISELADREKYLKICKDIEIFLSGDVSQTIINLESEMNQAAENTQFEWAAMLRNRIKKLNILLEPENPPAARLPDGQGRAGLVSGSKYILKGLRDLLNIEKLPIRIEAFDISNISGTDNVASMVVFENGIPKKSHYRKFKLLRQDYPDDFVSMSEVVGRRYKGSLKEKLPVPDLILVDGGLGQVNAAANTIQGTVAEDVPVIGLAKKEELIYFPNKAEPLKLSKSSHELHLLQRIRDEAHRFAITYHKLIRKKRLTQ